ncbi:MAG: DUF2589 domain-containing protein [Lachnospiraceae bacterium]|nr:DUF2589 domain-containing protein [Lachnospiraceae bacterium]
MAIAEQFAGLQMDQLIGGPLSAAADASTLLANSTADFINRVGFDAGGKVRNVAFGYQKRTPNEDGTSTLDEMKVSVPMLAIVPIPNLQIDEVNILFDMEVKQSERQESATDLSATVSGSANFGIVKVNVTGSVSSHQSNTRSSDNSAKYHVDVRATNHGIPEGLARVLDMMAANVAPELLSSDIKDGNGQDLAGQAKAKAERLKSLRAEISQIESRLSAAQDGVSASIIRLKKVADVQLNSYRELLSRKLRESDPSQYDEEIKKLEKVASPSDEQTQSLKKAKDEKAAAETATANYTQYLEEINQSWSNFQTQASDYVKLIADSGSESTDVSSLFALKGLKKGMEGEGDNKKETIEGTVDYAKEESQYDAMLAAQNTAVKNQKNASDIETELINKKSEYSDAISGRALPDKSGQQ